MASLPVGEEPTRVVLSFLPFADVADGVRCASSGWKLTCDSEAMTRARGQAEYALRGNHHGIVHALATAFGTRPWERTNFNDWEFLDSDSDEQDSDLEDDPRYNIHRPPSQIRVTFCRQGQSHRAEDGRANEPFHRYSECRLCSPLLLVDTGFGCQCGLGSYVEYLLPFSVRLDRFRLGYTACLKKRATGWTFGGFDARTRRWTVLFDASNGDPDIAKDMWSEDVAPFVSDRFRVHSADREPASSFRCMHVRGVELFGTIMPGWDVAACLDRAQPSRNVHSYPGEEG